MRRWTPFVLPAVLLAAVGWSESLGEIAERERQKQKEKKSRPGRVYTDADLPRPTPTPEGGAPAEATPVPESGSSVSETTHPWRGWQERAKAVRAQLAQARNRLDEAQAKLDKLRSPHHVLHPFGHGNPEVPPAVEAVDSAKEALTQAEAELAAFEKEAAAAGVPSRWIEPQ